MNLYKINIPKSIIVLIVLSVTLNILRVIIWGKFSFMYILWNVFLAILPFIISSAMLNANNQNKLTPPTFFIFGIIWLLFIPNSPYIITDLIHIGEVRSVPALFDSFLLFSSAWAGILLGMYSINHIEQIIMTKYSKKITSIILVKIMLLISFGMYLGRFLRLNSWDIFTSPSYFFAAVKEIFTNKDNLKVASLYTLLFFFFMLMSYSSWKLSQRNE